MTAESRKELMNAQTAKGIFCAEVKTENLINRSVGMAEPPRTQERVPAGTKFKLEISVRLFDDDEAEIMGLLRPGLDLLQQDYLGASGSRGYGKVSLDYRVVEPEIRTE